MVMYMNAMMRSYLYIDRHSFDYIRDFEYSIIYVNEEKNLLNKINMRPNAANRS